MGTNRGTELPLIFPMESEFEEDCLQEIHTEGRAWSVVELMVERGLSPAAILRRVVWSRYKNQIVLRLDALYLHSGRVASEIRELRSLLRSELLHMAILRWDTESGFVTATFDALFTQTEDFAPIINGQWASQLSNKKHPLFGHPSADVYWEAQLEKRLQTQGAFELGQSWKQVVERAALGLVYTGKKAAVSRYFIASQAFIHKAVLQYHAAACRILRKSTRAKELVRAQSFVYLADGVAQPTGYGVAALLNGIGALMGGNDAAKMALSAGLLSEMLLSSAPQRQRKRRRDRSNAASNDPVFTC